MYQTWTLCLWALVGAGADEDVKFHMTHLGTSINPQIEGKFTGCSLSQQVVKLTCDDAEKFKGMKLIPDRAFRTVVNCQNMGEDFAWVKLLSGPQCGKLVFTQHTEQGANVSQGQVLLERGQVAEITCVAWPLSFGTGGTPPDSEGFFTIGDPITLEATGAIIRHGQNEESSPEFWEIGRVKAKNGNEDKVKDSDCVRAVEGAFMWKLSLVRSSQNVHELQWSSQPEEPSESVVPMVSLEKSLPAKSTSCLKDVPFKQINAQVVSAKVKGSLADVKQAVQLHLLDDGAHDMIPKHEEIMRLLVDASQLPKEGEKILSVGISYKTPGWKAAFDETTYLELPIADPNVPDSQPDGKPDQPDQPDKKADQGGGLGAGFWVVLILILGGLGVGAFLYRRNMLIQANARQPLP